MLIKENSNLQKDIKNYKKYEPFPKEIEILLRLTIVSVTTLIGWAASPIIAYTLLNDINANWQLLLAGSISIGAVLQAIIVKPYKKQYNKKYEIAKKNLQLIIDFLRDEQKIQVDTNTIVNAVIDETTTKAISEKGLSKKVTKTTITNFYLLDKEDKIRVLKEVKKTITKNHQKTITGPNLYLEEKSEINIEELPVRKTLKLK